MKLAKSWICSALAGLVLLGGCSSKPSVPEVTLIVKTPTLTMNTVGDLQVESSEEFLQEALDRFAASYDKADVKYKIGVFDYVDEEQAITGTFDTKLAPDILYEGYFNMGSYVSTGRVVPLDDIISDEVRADINESAWSQSMKDGRTYMMPYLSMQNIMIFNKDLFRQCGLDAYCLDETVIQNWSLEEWETILDTLAEKLPEESFPMMMYGANNQGDTHILTLLRMFGSDYFLEDGSFDFTNPDVVKALAWIQDGTQRGWYAPHAELLEMVDSQQLFESGRLAIYMFNNANYPLYENIEDNYGFVNFPGNHATSFITGFEVFDNGDDVRLQTAKDFIQFLYADEELMSGSAGNIPESKKVAETYMEDIIMLEQFADNEENVIDFMRMSPNWQGKDDSVRSVFWQEIHELLAGRVTPEECAKRLNHVCNAAIADKGTLHP